MAAIHPFDEAMLEIQVAHQAGNVQLHADLLSVSSRHLHALGMSPDIVVERHELWNAARGLGGDEVKAISSDWAAVQRRRQEEGVVQSMMIREMILGRPIFGRAARLFDVRGRPRSAFPWFDPLDLMTFGPPRWQADGRQEILNLPEFTVPGNYRAMVVRAPEMGGIDPLFDASFDGENVFGTVARSFIPLRVMQFEVAPLLCMESDVQFARQSGRLGALARANKLDVVGCLLSSDELVNAFRAGRSVRYTVDCLIHQMKRFQAMCRSRLVFGGFALSGSNDFQSFVGDVSMGLFQQAQGLLGDGILYFDVSLPSRFVDLQAVFGTDEQYRGRMCANAMWALGILMKLHLHNLGWPLVTMRPGDLAELRFNVQRVLLQG